MKNKFLALMFVLCAGAATAAAGDVPHYAQIDMKAPPVNPTNVTTKDYVDTADSDLETKIDGAVFYDADGNISYPAGLSLQVKMPDGTKKDVLATDTNGNALLGEADLQVNITASQRPTMTIAGDAADGIATLTDLTDFVTETDLDAEMAYKADLVGGVVPDAQLPAHVKVTNWGPVAAETDLVTLTAATVNDRAFVGAAPGPYTTYYLLAMPPTTQTNWIQAGGGGSGTSGVESVNGDTGPAVTVDLAQFPDVQTALDDKADAADLALLAPLASPALTGTPTAPTAPANAVGSQIINADALRTAMTGNLGATSPLMDWTASAGAATTVARSDHVHPTDTTRAPLDSPALTGSPTTTEPPADSDDNSIATTSFVRDVAGSGGGGGVTWPVDIASRSNLFTYNGNILLGYGSSSSLRVGNYSKNVNTALNLQASSSVNINVGNSAVKLAATTTGGSLSGTWTAPTPEATSNDTTIATTGFVKAAGGLKQIFLGSSGDSTLRIPCVPGKMVYIALDVEYGGSEYYEGKFSSGFVETPFVGSFRLNAVTRGVFVLPITNIIDVSRITYGGFHAIYAYQ